jgi:carbamoyl-phosphate synthase large subunit
MHLTIAVTGLHGGENPQPGVGIIRSLRRRFDNLTILGLVYDVLESGIYLADCADVVFELPYPSTGTDALLTRLDQIRAQYPIDMLIPTLDAEILPMIKLQDALTARGIKAVLPTEQAFTERNKSKLPELAAACECLTPRTRKAVDAQGVLAVMEEFTYPVMIKGQYYEAYKASSQQELLAYYSKIIASWGVPVLIQQFISGQEFNVMAVGDGHGDVAAFCAIRKMIRSKQGKGYGGIVMHDEELNQISQCLIQQLAWYGPLELEFVRDEASGKYYLLEINPRFPAWVDFPSTFGCNMPSLIVDELAYGGMQSLPACTPGMFYVRHSVDITGRVEDLGTLTSDGEWRCEPHTDQLIYS